MELLYVLLIGALSGWLAGNVMRGGGFGLLVNIILGIVGAFVGNWLFHTLDISIASGVLGDLITGFIGSVVVLLVAGLFKK